MSANANIYILQNVECHGEISSRSPRFTKLAVMNLSPKWCFKAEFLSQGARLWLWFDSRLRHNAFRKSIVPSTSRVMDPWFLSMILNGPLY